MRQLSIIIHFSGAEPDKVRNLLAVLSVIEQQRLYWYELILVEQATESYPRWRPLCDLISARHIWIGDAVAYPVYRPSWMKNVGAREANSELIMFIGHDLIFGSTYIADFLRAFRGNFMLGWNKAIKLNKEATVEYLKARKYTTELKPRDMGYVWRWEDDVAWGAPVLFERDFYLNKLGGGNESYRGWGCEDRGAHARCRALTGRDDYYPYTLLHLHHRRSPVDPALLAANDAILRKVMFGRQEALAASEMMVTANQGQRDRPATINWDRLGEL